LENHEWPPSFFRKYKSIELTPSLLLNQLPFSKKIYKFWQGEKLKLFYNPAATQLVPNEEFGIAFNGNFCNVTWFPKNVIFHIICKAEYLDSL